MQTQATAASLRQFVAQWRNFLLVCSVRIVEMERRTVAASKGEKMQKGGRTVTKHKQKKSRQRAEKKRLHRAGFHGAILRPEHHKLRMQREAERHARAAEYWEVHNMNNPSVAKFEIIERSPVEPVSQDAISGELLPPEMK